MDSAAFTVLVPSADWLEFDYYAEASNSYESFLSEVMFVETEDVDSNVYSGYDVYEANNIKDFSAASHQSYMEEKKVELKQEFSKLYENAKKVIPPWSPPKDDIYEEFKEYGKKVLCSEEKIYRKYMKEMPMPKIYDITMQSLIKKCGEFLEYDFDLEGKSWVGETTETEAGEMNDPLNVKNTCLSDDSAEVAMKDFENNNSTDSLDEILFEDYKENSYSNPESPSFENCDNWLSTMADGYTYCKYTNDKESVVSQSCTDYRNEGALPASQSKSSLNNGIFNRYDIVDGMEKVKPKKLFHASKNTSKLQTYDTFLAEDLHFLGRLPNPDYDKENNSVGANCINSGMKNSPVSYHRTVEVRETTHRSRLSKSKSRKSESKSKTRKCSFVAVEYADKHLKDFKTENDKIFKDKSYHLDGSCLKDSVLLVNPVQPFNECNGKQTNSVNLEPTKVSVCETNNSGNPIHNSGLPDIYENASSTLQSAHKVEPMSHEKQKESVLLDSGLLYNETRHAVNKSKKLIEANSHKYDKRFSQDIDSCGSDMVIEDSQEDVIREESETRHDDEAVEITMAEEEEKTLLPEEKIYAEEMVLEQGSCFENRIRSFNEKVQDVVSSHNIFLSAEMLINDVPDHKGIDKQHDISVQNITEFHCKSSARSRIHDEACIDISLKTSSMQPDKELSESSSHLSSAHCVPNECTHTDIEHTKLKSHQEMSSLLLDTFEDLKSCCIDINSVSDAEEKQCMDIEENNEQANIECTVFDTHGNILASHHNVKNSVLNSEMNVQSIQVDTNTIQKDEFQSTDNSLNDFAPPDKCVYDVAASLHVSKEQSKLNPGISLSGTGSCPEHGGERLSQNKLGSNMSKSRDSENPSLNLNPIISSPDLEKNKDFCNSSGMSLNIVNEHLKPIVFTSSKFETHERNIHDTCEIQSSVHDVLYSCLEQVARHSERSYCESEICHQKSVSDFSDFPDMRKIIHSPETEKIFEPVGSDNVVGRKSARNVSSSVCCEENTEIKNSGSEIASIQLNEMQSKEFHRSSIDPDHHLVENEGPLPYKPEQNVGQIDGLSACGIEKKVHAQEELLSSLLDADTQPIDSSETTDEKNLLPGSESRIFQFEQHIPVNKKSNSSGNFKQNARFYVHDENIDQTSLSHLSDTKAPLIESKNGFFNGNKCNSSEMNFINLMEDTTDLKVVKIYHDQCDADDDKEFCAAKKAQKDLSSLNFHYCITGNMSQQPSADKEMSEGLNIRNFRDSENGENQEKGTVLSRGCSHSPTSCSSSPSSREENFDDDDVEIDSSYNGVSVEECGYENDNDDDTTEINCPKSKKDDNMNILVSENANPASKAALISDPQTEHSSSRESNVPSKRFDTEILDNISGFPIDSNNDDRSFPELTASTSDRKHVIDPEIRHSSNGTDFPENGYNSDEDIAFSMSLSGSDESNKGPVEVSVDNVDREIDDVDKEVDSVDMEVQNDDFLSKLSGFTFKNAYQLCSIEKDVRITPMTTPVCSSTPKLSSQLTVEQKSRVQPLHLINLNDPLSFLSVRENKLAKMASVQQSFKNKDGNSSGTNSSIESITVTRSMESNVSHVNHVEEKDGLNHPEMLLVELPENYLKFINIIEHSSAPIIGKIISCEKYRFLESCTFRELPSEKTRFMLNEEIKYCRDINVDPIEGGLERSLYSRLLALHGFVKAFEYMLQIDLSTAVKSLKEYESEHQILLRGIFGSLYERLSATFCTYSGHPKIEKVCSYIADVYKKCGNNSNKFKVLVIVKQHLNILFPIFKSCLDTMLRGTEVVLIPQGIFVKDCLKVIQEKVRCIFLVHVSSLSEENCWSEFMFVVEYENCTASVWNEFCRKAKVPFISVKIANVSCRTFRDIMKLSSNEMAGCFEPLKNKLKHSVLIASRHVTSDERLLQMMESKEEIYVMERDYAERFPHLFFPDIDIDQSSCVILVNAVSLKEQGTMDFLISKVSFLCLKYEICWIIYYKSQGISGGYMVTDCDEYFPLLYLTTEPTVLGSSSYSVKLLFAYSYEEIVDLVSVIVRMANQRSKRVGSFLGCDFLKPEITEEELFLVSLSCFNPFMVQYILSLSKFEQLFLMDLDTLVSKFKKLPSQSLEHFYRLIHVEYSDTPVDNAYTKDTAAADEAVELYLESPEMDYDINDSYVDILANKSYDNDDHESFQSMAPDEEFSKPSLDTFLDEIDKNYLSLKLESFDIQNELEDAEKYVDYSGLVFDPSIGSDNVSRVGKSFLPADESFGSGFELKVIDDFSHENYDYYQNGSSDSWRSNIDHHHSDIPSVQNSPDVDDPGGTSQAHSNVLEGWYLRKQLSTSSGLQSLTYSQHISRDSSSENITTAPLSTILHPRGEKNYKRISPETCEDVYNPSISSYRIPYDDMWQKPVLGQLSQLSEPYSRQAEDVLHVDNSYGHGMLYSDRGRLRQNGVLDHSSLNGLANPHQCYNPRVPFDGYECGNEESFVCGENQRKRKCVKEDLPPLSKVLAPYRFEPRPKKITDWKSYRKTPSPDLSSSPIMADSDSCIRKSGEHGFNNTILRPMCQLPKCSPPLCHHTKQPFWGLQRISKIGIARPVPQTFSASASQSLPNDVGDSPPFEADDDSTASQGTNMHQGLSEPKPGTSRDLIRDAVTLTPVTKRKKLGILKTPGFKGQTRLVFY